MRNRAMLCVLALALVAIGYLLGTRASNASASPVEGTSAYRYLTSGNEARELVVWQMHEGKPVSARVYWASASAEELTVVAPQPK